MNHCSRYRMSAKHAPFVKETFHGRSTDMHHYLQRAIKTKVFRFNKKPELRQMWPFIFQSIRAVCASVLLLALFTDVSHTMLWIKKVFDKRFIVGRYLERKQHPSTPNANESELQTVRDVSRCISFSFIHAGNMCARSAGLQTTVEHMCTVNYLRN